MVVGKNKRENTISATQRRRAFQVDINQGNVGSMRNVALVALTKSMPDELETEGINVTVVHRPFTS